MSKEEILKHYKRLLVENGVNLEQVNAGYDFYKHNILIWINTNDLKVEEICIKIEKEVNELYISSNILITTTIIPNWVDLPLPSSYTELR